jgi:hypothetical protein
MTIEDQRSSEGQSYSPQRDVIASRGYVSQRSGGRFAKIKFCRALGDGALRNFQNPKVLS